MDGEAGGGDNNNSTEMGGGGGGGSSLNGAPASSSRWNPTKEQINILENLYKQGVRTPSADQIQQITNRLKAYGHIEGKNVFYWFQNHKARQRQKQKQESLAFFNRFLHINHSPPHHPLFAPQFPSPNVYRPYYMHQNDVGFHPQYNNTKMLQTSNMVRRRSKSERKECNGSLEPGSSEQQYNTKQTSFENNRKETLCLFPTHPTGDLQVGPAPAAAESAASATFGGSVESSSFNGCYGNEEGGCDCRTYDFFCRGGSY